MKKLIGFLGLILLLGMIAPGDPNQEGGKYSVDAIHAHLYYHATGKINPTDLLDGRSHALWNTIIGEGEAREPSAAIMVLVDITGPGFLRCEGKLRLTATDSQKTLLDQTLELGLWFNERGKVTLPFFACGTGCEEVTIIATLEGLPASKVDTETLTKIIPFECGE
jgi:hypothetical protein